MKEELILYRLRKKDTRGLEMAMEQYSGYVSKVVWNILQGSMSIPDAEEVAADVFVTLWERAADVQPGKLKPWLAAVARNTARHKLRNLGKELPLEEDLLEISDGSTPLEEMIREEERRVVRQAVEGLGEPERELFLRHYYYIQPIREISQEMGMKESTIKSHLHRGRLRLKAMLQEWGAV